MDTKILKDLGLTSAETKVYLALLELGESKTGRIIDKSKLQSSTVYHSLGSLVEKGLVSYILKGKTKYFQAESPETFIDFLDEKKKRFKKILPDLKKREKLSKRKLKAEVYEGMKGMKACFNDILKTLDKGDVYYFFSAPGQKVAEGKRFLFFRNHHLKRAEHGIKVRGLSTKKDENILKKLFKNIKLAKIRFVDEFAPTGVVVYSNKLIHWDWEDEDSPMAFVLKSKSIADSYKDFFKKMWKKSVKN